MEKSRDIIKRVKKIEIKTRKVVESLMQGEYLSVFKGRGIEFSDVREYVPGDDIRSIDWNITARMHTPYIKEYIEERNLTVYIVFDVSASSEFGSEKQKKEAAIELAASVMFSAARNHDSIGLCLFTKDIELFIPPKTTRRHALRLLRHLLYFEPKHKTTDLKAALARLGKIAKKRSVIFLISDFFTADFDKELRTLKSRHDVIAINYRDIREQEIPDVGYIELEDAESGEQILVDTKDPLFRRNYLNLVEQKRLSLESIFKRLHVDMIQLGSGEDFVIPIKRFFALRERRMAR